MKNELALAIGYIYGDGGIQNNGRVHYCNTEDFLVKEFTDTMNKVFDVKPWIKREKNIIRVRYPVKIGRTLWKLFGKFSYGKDTKNITPEISEMSLEWKRKVLQAWFNDDGSVVNLSPNYKAISIKQKLKPLIIFIKEVLEELNIKSQITEDNGKWLLRIFGYQNMIKFRDNVNFSKGYRKNKKLDETIESITRPHFIMKEKILNLLKNSPKTIKDISETLNTNRHVVYCHLHGWKRKNRKSAIGLLDLGLAKVKKDGRINIYTIKNT